MSIRTSQNTEQLDEAFAKAQAKFEAAAKDSKNPHFNSKYADISSIIEATLEHLNAEGIGVRQHPSFEFKGEGDNREAFITVTTRLAFKGQWEESDLSIPAVQRDRFDAQSCGSAVTYGCRYALQGIFCVRRADDDANLATGRGSTEAAQAVAKEKISQAAKAGNKTAIKAQEAQQQASSELLYCWPVAHNGHFAEFLNIRAYLAAHLDEEDALRMAFTAHGGKKTKEETALVPEGKVEHLLEVLVGDMGIKVHKLEAK